MEGWGKEASEGMMEGLNQRDRKKSRSGRGPLSACKTFLPSRPPTLPSSALPAFIPWSERPTQGPITRMVRVTRGKYIKYCLLGRQGREEGREEEREGGKERGMGKCKYDTNHNATHTSCGAFLFFIP